MQEVYDNQVRNLIAKLIDFLGVTEVRRKVAKYEESVQMVGPILANYYVKHKHPWWGAIKEYWELDRGAKCVRRNMTPEIQLLAVHAKKLKDLMHSMPDSVKTKYRTNLLSDKTAYGYLFEIEMAWHFVGQGCSVQWSDAPEGCQPEFLVRHSACEFNVECKTITENAFRKVHWSDLCRFADKLVEQPSCKGYMGEITITLENRLPSRDDLLDRLVTEVSTIIDRGQVAGSYPLPSGSVSLNLTPRTGAVVDPAALYADLLARKPPHARGVLYCPANGRRHVDPIRIIVVSERADEVLKGIREELSEAAKKQLEPSMPGFIACFLEGLDNLTGLGGDSGLRRMTHDLFNSDSRSHIAGVGYHGQTLVRKERHSEVLFSQGLVFHNSRCRFSHMKNFAFLSHLCETS